MPSRRGGASTGRRWPRRLGGVVGPAPVLLAVRGLSRRYGGLLALSDYSLDLSEGIIHGVIGPNGAGKTTLFNLLSGMVRPTEGSISLLGQDITGLPGDKVALLGIARTFQNIRLFGDMSVIDTVKVGVQAHRPASFWRTLLTTPAFREQEAGIEARAAELLELVGLADRAQRPARSLPYGDQRRLEIVRALAIQPRVLLLDEPNAGMNPSETDELLAFITRIRDQQGVTIILIAHDIPLVMNVCDRIQVLNFGVLIAEGDPAAGAHQSRRGRRLPGQGTRLEAARRWRRGGGADGDAGCLSSRASASGTATSAPSPMSPSGSARASWWPSSAPTVPASRPPCAPSRGCCGHARGASATRAPRSRVPPPTASWRWASRSARRAGASSGA